MCRFKFDEVNSCYIFNGNSYFFILSAGTLFMAGAGINMIFDILPFEKGYTGADVFGLIFICVWTLLVFTGFIVAITNASKKIIICQQGVTVKTLIYRKEYLWSEIADWGLSYCGNTKGEGNTYYLYFAKEEQRTKNECSKRLNGKMIKTFIFEIDYDRVVNEVMPFCNNYTFIKPFVGVDKYHFFG